MFIEQVKQKLRLLDIREPAALQSSASPCNCLHFTLVEFFTVLMQDLSIYLPVWACMTCPVGSPLDLPRIKFVRFNPPQAAPQWLSNNKM